MSLFCGKNCKCTQKSKAAFPGQPDLQKGYRNACIANNSLTKQEYLCGGKYVDEQTIMLTYGYDPCIGGKSLPDVWDPTNERKENNEDFNQSLPVFIGIGALLVIALIVLYFVNRRK
jgi:hypothetical protein